MCIVVNYDDNGNGIYGSEHCPWEQRGGYKGRLSYHPSDESVKKLETKSLSKVKVPVFFRRTKETISFYSSFDDCGNYATKWCKKHCYLKSQPFSKNVTKKIQEVKLSTYIQKMQNEMCSRLYYRGLLERDLIKNINDEKYVTFFASGCLEDLGKLKNQFIENISSLIWEKSHEIKVRFYIRDPFIDNLKLKKNSTIILTIDNTTLTSFVKQGLKNRIINGINIIDHPDNKELINLILNKKFKEYLDLNIDKIDKVITCEECENQMLCFKQTERFILISKYKSGKE